MDLEEILRAVKIKEILKFGAGLPEGSDVDALSSGIELCEGDFDCDRDVDGSDLAALAANVGLLDLSTFAADFGRTNCPPCPD